MVEALPNRGVLRVVSPAALTAQLDDEAARRVKAEEAAQSPDELSDLAGFIRQRFMTFQRHRNNATAGWSLRLLAALRAFNGSYEAGKLAEIQKFGGSTVYARLIAMKCRGASSLLRDVYLGQDRPWGIAPPADPDVPPEVVANIQQLVQAEMQTLLQAGQPPDPAAIRDRTTQLMDAARHASRKRAETRAQLVEDKIDEILEDGSFYRALAEFLVDLPLFPFACLKGPTVKVVPSVKWENGKPTQQQTPRLVWQRISPFDVWWTPGAADIEDAEVVERVRLTRSDLNDALDLPGYNTAAVRAVLDEHGRGGLNDNLDATDAERAIQESRENPNLNESGIITGLEFHGNVQGRMLLQYGLSKDQVPDEIRDYSVQAWMVGRHVIKVQLSPSPRRRHPYFITSFEKVPGTPVGNALPDILSDIQEVCNATLRALVNNLSIASGPQVVINTDRLAAGEDPEELHPWKRWHVISDPMGNNSQVPVSFFQPQAYAQELLAVYNQFTTIADEVSAIPKYLSGNGPGGGAGRTASGLAMLMGNASKILQTVAANVDRDVLEPILRQLFDMLMLTDQTGLLQGDETVRVLGVNVAVQRETQRSRQLEFLKQTANPIDAQIMGPKGRAEVLRAVASTIGIEGAKIVPTSDEIDAMQAQQQALAAQNPQQLGQQGAKAEGQQSGPGATGDMGPRTRIAGGVG